MPMEPALVLAAFDCGQSMSSLHCWSEHASSDQQSQQRVILVAWIAQRWAVILYECQPLLFTAMCPALDLRALIGMAALSASM